MQLRISSSNPQDGGEQNFKLSVEVGSFRLIFSGWYNQWFTSRIHVFSKSARNRFSNRLRVFFGPIPKPAL
jgi:hypothetical protein